MSLTHKTQSALEYMMTYGWAILIIVIVAAVLYSLGIFNPSSSAPSSVTGFGGFVIPQGDYVCNSSGVFIQIADITGYPVTVTWAAITSGSGLNSTSSNGTGLNIGLAAQSSATIKAGKGSACTSGGVRYSAGISFGYTESTSLGRKS